ncbi:uncharacterized protein LOC117373723 [Periophthalmus magnuspinnatus]|uniref:uncharacterized protein LOC117373723 n=1 Tax=Periophthalmus magnuspinnatus TaxID=409849 RepID=UPI00145BEDFD|nr:uncharacterized protein LOC117373723 [Periophthalmus magnuspinnatus]
MSTATVPVANVPSSEMEGRNASYHGSISDFVQTQCSPMPKPTLGFQRIIYGNGTNVGTVIALRCPDKHKLIGDSVKCVLDANSTHWEGETYCKPLSFNEISGFQLAILVSIVSSAVIFFMSMAFLTCCLVDCIEKRKRKEMERYPEMPPQWGEQNYQQEMNRPPYSNKGRNNNNNNHMEKELTQWNHHDPGQSDDRNICRCQQQYNYDLIGPSSSYNAAARFPLLPGYEYDQALLPLNPNSSNVYNQHTEASRQTLSSDQVQVDFTRSDPGWQYGAHHQGSFPGTTNQTGIKNSAKEFSIRVISV